MQSGTDFYRIELPTGIMLDPLNEDKYLLVRGWGEGGGMKEGQSVNSVAQSCPTLCDP